jgi:hypothetical protein
MTAMIHVSKLSGVQRASLPHPLGAVSVPASPVRPSAFKRSRSARFGVEKQ